MADISVMTLTSAEVGYQARQEILIVQDLLEMLPPYPRRPETPAEIEEGKKLLEDRREELRKRREERKKRKEELRKRCEGRKKRKEEERKRREKQKGQKTAGINALVSRL